MQESESVIRKSDEKVIRDYTDYRLLRTHGVSQLGTVSGFGHLWFVKSISEPFRESCQCRMNLIKEYDILVSLRRGPVADAISLCDIEGVGLSIVMEYVNGEHLDKYMAHAPRRLRKKVLRRLVDAVAFIHSRGVVHLDLKPENILVHGSAENPEVCLIDFNLSDTPTHLYNKGIGGNIKYAAPEQFEDGYAGDSRSDVWSLGRLLKEFGAGLTWRPAIRKALNKEPKKRPSDASSLIMSEIRFRRASYFFLSACAIIAICCFCFYMSSHDVRYNKVASVSTYLSEQTAIDSSENTLIDSTDSKLSYTGTPGRLEQTSGKVLNDVHCLTEEDAEMMKFVRAHDAAVIMVTKNFEAVEAELMILINDSSIRPRKRYPNAILIQKMNSAWNPLLNLRDTTPPHILKKMPEEWSTYDDKDISPMKKRIGELIKRCDELMSRESER